MSHCTSMVIKNINIIEEVPVTKIGYGLSNLVVSRCSHPGCRPNKTSHLDTDALICANFKINI